MRKRFRNPGAESERQTLSRRFHAKRREVLAQGVDDVDSFARSDSWKKKQEFLAANAAEGSFRREPLAAEVGEVFQGSVASMVSVHVVQRLETIDVENSDAKTMVSRPAFREFVIEAIRECADDWGDPSMGRCGPPTKPRRVPVAGSFRCA